TPSGSALACEALLKLAAYTDKGEYRDLAEEALAIASEFTLKYPTSFARWLSDADFALGSVKQVAVVGEARDESFEAMIKLLRSAYRPNMIVAASTIPLAKDSPALLADRPALNKQATAYVCEGFVCRQPVTNVKELKEQIQ
ncbi:MAG TPA: hypothetical protein VMT73_14885, partial [Anaerolineales bacterium]|nr:hypothetical protein [Anaerolineales bacterium]